MATTVQQNIAIIENFLKQNELQKAHQACLELLRIDPENVHVIRLRNKITKRINKHNRSILKKAVQDLQPLWNNKQYREYLEKIQPLLTYIKDYPPLKKIALKAEEAYKQQYKVEQNDRFTQIFQNIQEFGRQKKYQEAAKLLSEINNHYPQTKQLQKITQQLRREWLQHELKQNENLRQSQRYEEILLLYQDLKRKFPEAKELEELIAKTKKDYQAQKIEEKKEFIYRSLEQIKTLLQLKKYEKATEAAKEILEIDPFNKTAQKFLQLANKKLEQQLSFETTTQILETRPELEKEFSTNPAAFKKL